MSLTTPPLNRATLGQQLLLRRERMDVAEAVRRVVAQNRSGRLGHSAQSLMTPTSQRITRTMMTTPTIPMPPPLISISLQQPARIL